MKKSTLNRWNSVSFQSDSSHSSSSIKTGHNAVMFSFCLTNSKPFFSICAGILKNVDYYESCQSLHRWRDAIVPPSERRQSHTSLSEVMQLTCVHALTVQLLGHLERSKLVRLDFAVEQRMELRHNSSLDHVDRVDTPRVLGYNCRLLKTPAGELIKVIARTHRKVHFRWNHRCWNERKSF